MMMMMTSLRSSRTLIARVAVAAMVLGIAPVAADERVDYDALYRIKALSAGGDPRSAPPCERPLPHEYLAPGLLFAETANTIWKKIHRGELEAAEGQRLVTDIGRIAVETVPCRALAQDAHALANATGRTVYREAPSSNGVRKPGLKSRPTPLGGHTAATEAAT